MIKRDVRKPHARRIIDVDDGVSQSRPGKENRLGALVGFKRLVIVEMVAREVREGRGLQLSALQASLLKANGTCLKRKGLRPERIGEARISCMLAASGVVSDGAGSSRPFKNAPIVPITAQG